jgi:serine/threonine-protein kinase
VVAIVDVDRTPDGRPFLVTELLEGKELGEYLNEKGKLPVATAVRIGLQIAGALSAAHARGIIHRDMKPENIFLTGDLADPIAKILDFGLSRLDRREGRQLTQAGAVLGTPSFMPPEQARGAPVDHRADVYAVGAILYTALTGQRPFDAETPAQTLLAVLAGAPLPPRDLEPTIPEALERVVLRAMSREPDQRYATMDELAQALGRSGGHGEAPAVPTAAPAGPAKTLADVPNDFLSAHAGPALDVLLGAVFGWAFASLAAVLSGLVRVAHAGGDALSGGESALVLVVVVAALGPPLFLAVRERLRGTWSKPAQAAAIVRRAAPSVLGGLSAYGLGAAAVRGLEATFLGSRGSWAGWEVVLVVLGLAGAALPLLFPQAKRAGR